VRTIETAGALVQAFTRVWRKARLRAVSLCASRGPARADRSQSGAAIGGDPERLLFQETGSMDDLTQGRLLRRRRYNHACPGTEANLSQAQSAITLCRSGVSQSAKASCPATPTFAD